MTQDLSIINKLLSLAAGQTLPDSRLRRDIFREMQAGGVLIAVTHGSRKAWRAADEAAVRRFAAERLGLTDLESCRDLMTDKAAGRAEMVAVTGDSKFIKRRSFTGFLVASLVPIEISVGGCLQTVSPSHGTFTFVFDYQTLSVASDIIVVGIENVENFRRLEEQRSFFEHNVAPAERLLFVCRYPQNGDLVRWLKSVDNRYVHFGDFDLAGVSIYLTEFYRHLGLRSKFLVPHNVEALIEKGSQERYEVQYARFRDMKVTDERVRPLVDAINRLHRGYDQEGIIAGHV